ncbi:MAG: YeeE/YedE family protein [Xanthomonadales bacterium]|nr:hypothetical protein [Xanthomonadales bacterium]MCC6593897.1 YeeE/YedE family protein [Xanthomonadales bacterium]MCE7932746.1 YeeE/YedE family protein [Xanthomonadales bacterium PRO6]
MLTALLGGALIGLAATLFLAFNGRIAGVSTIFGDLLLRRGDGGSGWRAAFVAGLVLASLGLSLWRPELGQLRLQAGPAGLIVAGLLVGYGTRMGGGCTSGHGVCGLARFSPRSLLATGVFMGVAMLTVALVRHSGVFA